MIVEFPTAKTAASRAAKRLAASRPRRSKNGTPEERAAKAGTAPAADRPRIPRRSTNGTPGERAAKMASATVLDVTSRLASRAAAAQRRTAANRPTTKEEFAVLYNAATPTQQAIVRAMMERAIEDENRPKPPAA
jgi:hypothetical protein